MTAIVNWPFKLTSEKVMCFARKAFPICSKACVCLLDEKSLGKIGPGTTPIEVLKSRSNRGRLDKVKHSPSMNRTYGNTGFTVDKLAIFA